MKNSQLFDLIDVSYSEDLTDQPPEYKKCLLKCAQELVDGTDEITVCVHIYECYHDNFMVPMTLPRKNRQLCQYVKEKLKKMDQKRMRDFNLGYGLIATHITFGTFN